MRYQEHIIEATREAAESTFRYLRAVPADKLEWQPAETSRHALDLAREIAWCPLWSAELLEGKPFEWSPEIQEQMKAKDSQWKTVADCERVFAEHFARYEAVVSALSDEDLAKTQFLPFDGGRDHSYKELAAFPHWNIVYHQGQVAYIQTLYGDGNMY